MNTDIGSIWRTGIIGAVGLALAVTLLSTRSNDDPSWRDVGAVPATSGLGGGGGRPGGAPVTPVPGEAGQDGEGGDPDKDPALVPVPDTEARPVVPPPGNLAVADHPWDDGRAVDLTWEGSAGLVFKVEHLGHRNGDDEPDAEFEWAEFTPDHAELALTVDKLDRGREYTFKVTALDASGNESMPAEVGPFRGTMQPFDGQRFWLFIITLIFCGAVIYWIRHARSGKPIRVRKIAGLEAVDEAVGRATEMGRSCLYVPGIQDINDIQTIASLTVLARVAKTAAEYDAKVEVPTARSLVMTTARETVQAAYLAAGRPDAYNQDLIYYVTDEQFGYVAYLQGMMVREKPAACFYMGAFFAESLILAETGNSIGAIQIAGTAMPAQLPFFVAACDYTLIGEEFFAASAYLSGSPEELGSLKGQDVGKVVVAVLLVLGVALATFGSMTGSSFFDAAVDYLKSTVLT